jgi:tubulin-like protein CetZ
MDEAISKLSVHGNPADARRALYLLAAPSGEMNMDMVKELGNHLKSLAPGAIIRTGDYPRDKGTSLDVSVILSEFSDITKIRQYFTKTISLMNVIQKRQEGIESGNRALDGTLKDIPSLL